MNYEFNLFSLAKIHIFVTHEGFMHAATPGCGEQIQRDFKHVLSMTSHMRFYTNQKLD